MSTIAASPHMVPAPRFLAWWRKLIELEEQLPEEMTDHEWITGGQEIRVLLADLGEVGMAAGAILPYSNRETGEGDGPAYELGETVNPDFDWEHGVIDLQARQFYLNDGIDRASGLVASLVRITGISES